MYIPQWWASGTVAKNLVFWKEHDKGGHFPCYECPELLASDLREFTKLVDKDIVKSMQGSQSGA